MPVGPTADFSSIAMDDREGSNALNTQSGVTITCLSAQPGGQWKRRTGYRLLQTFMEEEFTSRTFTESVTKACTSAKGKVKEGKL